MRRGRYRRFRRRSHMPNRRSWRRCRMRRARTGGAASTADKIGDDQIVVRFLHRDNEMDDEREYREVDGDRRPNRRDAADFMLLGVQIDSGREIANGMARSGQVAPRKVSTMMRRGECPLLKPPSPAKVPSAPSIRAVAWLGENRMMAILALQLRGSAGVGPAFPRRTSYDISGGIGQVNRWLV